MKLLSGSTTSVLRRDYVCLPSWVLRVCLKPRGSTIQAQKLIYSGHCRLSKDWYTLLISWPFWNTGYPINSGRLKKSFWRRLGQKWPNFVTLLSCIQYIWYAEKPENTQSPEGYMKFCEQGNIQWANQIPIMLPSCFNERLVFQTVAGSNVNATLLVSVRSGFCTEKSTVEKLGEHWSIILGAYFFGFLPWGIATLYDFISGKWKIIRDTRRAGRFHQVLFVGPIIVVSFYAVLQWISGNQQEMMTAIIAVIITFYPCVELHGVWLN